MKKTGDPRGRTAIYRLTDVGRGNPGHRIAWGRGRLIRVKLLAAVQATGHGLRPQEVAAAVSVHMDHARRLIKQAQEGVPPHRRGQQPPPSAWLAQQKAHEGRPRSRVVKPVYASAK